MTGLGLLFYFKNFFIIEVIYYYFYRGKLTFYTQPPAGDKVLQTKIVTEFGKEFDIDSLLKEENDIIESMDDTKLIVDGVEMTSNEPVKVNFEELEKEDVSSEDDEEEDDDDDDEDLTIDDEDDEKEENSKKVFDLILVKNCYYYYFHIIN
jgi:hypothetical protein